MSLVELNKTLKKTPSQDSNSNPMPRNTITKEVMRCRVLKLKNELYNGDQRYKGAEWHNGAHEMLNRVLDILQEYRD